MELVNQNASEVFLPTPIRQETVISRHPLHRLSRNGNIKIEINEQSPNGETKLRWKVSHNSEYGQPGPLAYKLDTLIINRRIEEAARPVPRLIRLGSLREIISELGTSSHNTEAVKNALRQNAFAGISAKFSFRTHDGTERHIEADFTRYSIVFTGEKLPNGRKADAVYVILNDVFIQVINGAITRPLDYDYLKSLPPAPQRFYELLSYQIYAAIKNDRPRARLIYSEFCMHAPQKRHIDWENVRSQMNKIHRPHVKSGYIGKVDYQKTTDSEGKPDWIMLYQPGPRAKAEFRAFTKRGGPVTLEVEPFNPESSYETDSDSLFATLTEPLAPLAAELVGNGMTPAIARQIVAEHGEAEIRRQIEILAWHAEKKPGKITEPAAWLVSAIKTGHAAPKGFVPAAERLKHEEAKRVKVHAAAEARRQQHQKDAEAQAKEKRDAAYWASLTPEQQEELQAQADSEADPEHLKLAIVPLKNMGQMIRRNEYIRRLLDTRETGQPGE